MGKLLAVSKAADILRVDNTIVHCQIKEDIPKAVATTTAHKRKNLDLLLIDRGEFDPNPLMRISYHEELSH